MKKIIFTLLVVLSTLTHSLALEAAIPALSIAPADIVAFVDTYSSGPVNKAISVASLAEFEKNFGKFNSTLGADNRAYLQVKQFFLNGGKKAWISRVVAPNWIGSPELKTGIYALPEFNILVLPGLATLEESDAQAARTAALSLASAKNAFIIIDPPANIDPNGLLEWRDNASDLIEQNWAASYFPRIKIDDPSSPSKERFLELSGSMAALLASKSPWLNPSNITIIGAKGLEFTLDDRMLQQMSTPLNGVAINSLKSFPANSVIVWSARTLDGNSQDYRYIKTVRATSLIKNSVRTGLKNFASLPSNNDTLVKVKTSLTNLMTDLWKKGALVGTKAPGAFIVNTSLDSTQSRILNVSINVALSREGEFTELTFQQQLK